MTRYYNLTQIREEGKEEIYFRIKGGKLEILYHNDPSQAKSSRLEEISKDEMKIVLAGEIESLEKIKRMLKNNGKIL